MNKDDSKDALAERKKQLQRLGEFYRMGLVHSKAHVKHGIEPHVLMASVFDAASYALHARIHLALGRGGGVRVQTLLPYLVPAYTFLVQRRLVRPVVLLVAAAGAAAAFLMRRRGARLARL